MNVPKSIHLYAAVLLLLAGQTVLGAQQRIQARSINTCISRMTDSNSVYEKTKDDHEWHRTKAVMQCIGNR